jgi:hypothetical protein
MMATNYEGGMTLGELIVFLKGLPERAQLSPGFDDYVGNYRVGCLAFAPCMTRAAGEMLALARKQVGATHYSYKADFSIAYLMGLDTECYMARPGRTAEGCALTREWVSAQWSPKESVQPRDSVAWVSRDEEGKTSEDRLREYLEVWMRVQRKDLDDLALFLEGDPDTDEEP